MASCGAPGAPAGRLGGARRRTAGGPWGRFAYRPAVQLQSGGGVRRLDGDPVRRDPDRRGVRRQRGIRHGDRAPGVGSQGVQAGAEPVDGTRSGAAGHPELDHAVRLLGHRRRGRDAVERDEVAVADQPEDPGGGVEGPPVHPQLRALGPAAPPPVQVVRRSGGRQPYDVGRAGRAGERAGQRADRGGLVALDQHVAVAVLGHHGERDPHTQTPKDRPRGGGRSAVA
ncbi:hypothetical protein [Microtetraspora malaysiensis]|uniref:hypothetical protein n=1 Tax=Microtetraspora malaysiensis TaxID=161358 RepID=UPI003D8E7148